MVKSIHISNFLNRNCDLKWELNSNVNILGGANGCGKSSLFSYIKNTVIDIDDRCPAKDVHIEHNGETHFHVHSPNLCYIKIPGLQNNPNYTLFADIVDDFLAKYGKKIDRAYTKNIRFVGENNNIVKITELSKGESQLVNILLGIFLRENSTHIFDCVDGNLHIDWQEKLIDNLLLLCPNAQIIIATHSPYILGLKYSSPKYVFQMEELLIHKK